MIYYDLNMGGSEFKKDLSLINEAYRLGWNHINLLYSIDDYENSLKYRADLVKEVSVFNNFNIGFGLKLKVNKPNEIRKYIGKYRDEVDFISVIGGKNNINRSALENYQVDVLSKPYFKRSDCGINHVLAKEAVKNNVAVELCFKDVLSNFLSYRAKLISNFRDIINLQRKYKFPLIVTSGAEDIFDVRAPKDISSFFKVIGLNDDELDDVFYKYPKSLIDFSRDRKNMIYQGVRLLD